MTLGLFDPAFLGGLAAGGGGYDADAQDFINRVIAADVAAGNTSGLEVGVQDAYNTFFVGCKADGIFNALKASCILAGARTRAGALVPLLSSMPAPTSVNFVDADYNRETGLKGDGSTKHLNVNRNNNASTQNDRHGAVYATTRNTENVARAYMRATFDSGVGGIQMFSGASAGKLSTRCSTSSTVTSTGNLHGSAGFFGVSRDNASTYTARGSGTNETVSQASESLGSANIYVFAGNNTVTPAIDLYSDARISFYSVGESLNLALLDARVSTLMSDLAAAIP